MQLAQVVAEIRSGNEQGVDALYASVSDCARAQLFQSVDPQAVEDHLQEILLIVMAAIRSGELRDPLCLMGFVRTVTRRQVAVHIRRAIFRRRMLVSVETAHPPAAPYHESPEARLAVQERVASLQEVLRRLCARDREILVRFYFDEQDSESICQEMRLTPTQFRLYKSRALAKCGELSSRSRRIHSALYNHSTKPIRIA
jgi:RNA polymerase sigma factor (sigma-70 family)